MSRIKRLRNLLSITAALLLLPGAASAAIDNQAELFARVGSGLFVVEVVERASGNQNVIGSGFLVADDATGSAGDVLVTNYHVISDHLQHPESFDLRIRNHEDQVTAMRVVAVDIVHDLALLQPADGPGDLFSGHWRFPLADTLPLQGDDIVSLGNPYNIGISTVPGTYNGLVKKRYQLSIHFTGAVNPGMSGGPAINRDGAVIGVNVAGAGNSVSILIPFGYLRQLLLDYRWRPAGDYAGLRERIRQSLLKHQGRLIDELLAESWELSEFGPLSVPMEIRDYVTCSGSASTGEEDLHYEYHHSDCGVHDRIYLSSSLDTGPIEFDFGWYRSEELNGMQFSKVMEQLAFSPFNRSGVNDVTEFQCRHDILSLNSLGDVPFRGAYCVRAYVDYPELHDVLFYAISLQPGSESVYLHYTLSGFTREQSRAFNQRFIESVAWN